MTVKKLRAFIPSGVFFLCFFTFISFTDPQSLPLELLFVPFILIFLAIYFLVDRSLLAYGALSDRKRRAISIVSATLLTLLLSMQSIGQSSLLDILMGAVLLGLLVFYFIRADFLK